MEITNPILYSIWNDRYRKDEESLDGNLIRVANHCATNQQETEEFFDVMSEGLFFPGGRTMSNAGIGKSLTLNNCFVSPQINDDLSDIFSKVHLGAITHQKGGGIGYDFSQLRPKGCPTSNDAIASGPLSFMDVFNAQTATILQGSRRGANMGVMNIYHMDIEEFIMAKSSDPNRLVHFNISVMIDDEFMKAVTNDETIWLHHPVYDNEGKVLRSEADWIYKKEVNAKELWNLLIRQAYDTGEPGVLFYDNLNRNNNLHYIENIVCSNPCAEYVSGTVYGKYPDKNIRLDRNKFGGACNLGAIMLHNFVENPFKKGASVNYEKLERTVGTAVKFLDNIIDINRFPDRIYKNYQESFRTIGLEITGLADMLTMLNMKYSSPEAVYFVGELINKIALYAYRASVQLARTRGEFPFLDREKFLESGYMKSRAGWEWDEVKDCIRKDGIRNAKLLSFGPTGTLSLTFGQNCSSGIEPIFSLSYDRKIKIGGQSDDDVKIVKMEDYAYKLWKETIEGNIVNEDVFETALNLSVNEHVQMLKEIVKHVDMSCSKTINIPEDYSFEDTKEIYKFCWENGIKGCTIFRPNEIRQGILVTESPNKEKEGEKDDADLSHFPLDRVNSDFDSLPWGSTLAVSDGLIGRKRKIMSGCGSLHLQAWYEPETKRLMEIFLSKGSAGGCNSFMTGLSRTISLALRTGASFEYTIDQLRSVPPCNSYTTRNAVKKDCSLGNSCPSAIALALIEIQKELDADKITEIEMEKVINLTPEQNEFLKDNGEIAFSKRYRICPSCFEELKEISGCLQCNVCGWSKCD